MTARSYLVIGGGIVGVAAALRLRAAGLDITLIDPGDARRGASFGNIGHIAAEQSEPLASPRTLIGFPARLFAFGGPLAFRGRDIGLWAPWSVKFARACNASAFARGTMALDGLQRDALGAWARLFALAGMPSLVSPCGHFVVWMSPRAASRGLAAWRRAATASARFREMTAGELAHVGGAMRAPPVAGIAFSGTGQVSEPQAVRAALLTAFTAKGGVSVQGSVRTISVNANDVTVQLDGSETLNAEGALIAAGAWSKPLMRQLGITVPLIGERGYSVQSAEHRWPGDLPPVVFEERATVVTRFTSGLRASSFVEFGDPDAPGDARKWRRLERHVRELGISFSASPDRWSGPRPTLPDYLPAIGRMERFPRVLYAFGHQHLGLTLAGATAEFIEALATWVQPRIDATPFRVERFVA